MEVKYSSTRAFAFRLLLALDGGALPHNFLTTILDIRSARRAIRALKDEYLLDFINVEELDAGDIEDVDEKCWRMKFSRTSALLS